MRCFSFMWPMANYPASFISAAPIFSSACPFNIASYALLTMMVAQVCGLQAGEFIHTLGDAHIYSNHFEQTELQLARTPRKLPKMKLNPDVHDLFDFRFEDFELADYEPHPHIKAAVAV